MAYVQWLDMLRNGRKNENTLLRALLDADEYLNNIPYDQRDLAIEVIFKSDQGLFDLCKQILNHHQDGNKHIEFDDLLIKSFDVLKILIEHFNVKSYVTEIMDICFDCITKYHSKSKNTNVKYSASLVLRKLIETVDISYAELLNRTLTEIKNKKREQEVQKANKGADDETEVLYIIIGAIFKNHPNTKNLPTSIAEIYLSLLFNLEYQCYLPAEKRIEKDIAIYLDCMSDMSDYFDFFSKDGQSVYAKKLFDFLSFFNENHNGENIKRTVLHFLSKNINYFIDFLIPKFKTWHKSFLEMSKDDLKPVYEAISLYLLKNHEENLFLYLKNGFTQNINTTKLSSVDLSLDVYGLGKLIIAAVNYSVEKDESHRILQTVSYLTLPFFNGCNTGTVCMSAIHYLETLATVMCHSRYLANQYSHYLMDLMSTIISTFPQLKDQDQILFVNVIKQMSNSIDNMNSNFSELYTNFLVQELIKRSCQYALSTDLQLQIVIGNGNVTNSQHFQPIWKTLLTDTNAETEHFTWKFFEQLVVALFLSFEEMDLKLIQQHKLSFWSSETKVAKEIDSRHFLNLFNLYGEILEFTELSVLQKWLEKLLTTIIKYSYKHLSISGYYKLVTVLFKRLNSSKLSLESRICSVITTYVKDVAQFTAQCFDELQLSCINLILNAPIFSITEATPELILTFRVIFACYTSNNPVVHQSLDKLRVWTNEIESNDLQDFYESVCNIDLFNSQEFRMSKITERGRLHLKSKKDNLDSLYEWKWHNLGQAQTLNLKDIMLQLHIEKLLPKELEKENRRTQFSAYALFHNILTLILGKQLENQYLNKKVFMAVLQLGSNRDEAVRNLFHPLAMQLCYYFNTESFKESKIPHEFVDALFENLTDISKTLKKYSIACLQEFVLCYSKQNPSESPGNSTIVQYVALKIINLAACRSLNEKMSAAMIFNELFTLYTQRNVTQMCIMKMHWLELFLAFVKDLEECIDPHIERALENITNTFQVTVDAADSIKHMIMDVFLFRICKNFDPEKACHWLRFIESLCVFTSDFKTPDGFIRSFSLVDINRIAATGLENYSDVQFDNTKSLTRSLELYTWVLRKSSIAVESLLSAEQSSANDVNIFFDSLNKFVTILGKFDNTKKTDSEFKELIALINHTILQIAKFLTIVLTKKATNTVFDRLFTNDMLKLIYHLILYPRKIGLNEKTLLTMDSAMLDDLLVAMKDNLPGKHTAAIQNVFFNEMHLLTDITDLINLENNVDSREDFIEGIVRLRKCPVFDFGKEERNLSKRMITDIFEHLASNGELVNRQRWERLMEFLLVDHQPELVEFLINLTVGERDFEEPLDSSKQMFSTFKMVIARNLLQSPDESLEIIERVLQTMPKKLFYVIEELLLYSQFNEDSNSEILAEKVISKFDVYANLIGENETLKSQFFNINRLAVSMKNQNTDIVHSSQVLPSGLYQWILNEFKAAPDLDRKSILLDCFLVCMTDESSRKNANLTLILNNLVEGMSHANDDLKNKRRSELENNTIERLRNVNCLRVLLKQFVDIHSTIILEGIIRFSVGVCGILFKEINVKEYLKDYYNSVSDEFAVNTLEFIYRLFQTLKFSPEERLEILNYFLIPSIEICENVTEFYTSNYNTFALKLLEKIKHVSVIRRRQIVVTKIGSFKLFEIMFVKLSIDAFAILRVNSKKETLDACILKEAIETRSFSETKGNEVKDKELVRLLHCAALNCYIARACVEPDKDYVVEIFRESEEDAKPDVRIWQNIIDSERKYIFKNAEPTFKTKFINILKTEEREPSVPEVSLACNQDNRQSSLLEDDDVNDHECMAMISGAIIHIEKTRKKAAFHGEVIAPNWLMCFENILNSANLHSNLKLFLFRVIVNARQVFSIYLDYFFRSIVSQVHQYLEDNAINYLIRDVVLLFILEREPTPLEEDDKEQLQDLFENLINRAINENNRLEYEYNMEIIEKVVQKFAADLLVPDDFKLLTELNPEFALRVGLIMFRYREFDPKEIMKGTALYAISRKAMFKWMEPEAPRVYEFCGWILKYHSEDFRQKVVENDLVPLFTSMQNIKNNDFCFSMLHCMLKGCPELALFAKIKPFMDPTKLKSDRHKAQTFDLFLPIMRFLRPKAVFEKLEEMKLRKLMRDRAWPCLEIGFQIMDKLAMSFDTEKLLLPFAETMEQYAQKTELFEYKTAAYNFFIKVYQKFVKNISEDNRIKDTLIRLCEKILINGVADSSDEIQDKLLRFWKKDAGLSENSSERLQNLLRLYSPEVNENFSQFICLLVLDLSEKSAVNDKFMCQPLGANTFRDYEIGVARTATRSGIKVPEHPPPLADFLHIPAELENFTSMKEESSEKRLSRRFFPKSSEETTNNSSTNPPMNAHTYYAKLNEENWQQSNSVKINKKYRISDTDANYPDVEIRQSDLVALLADLVRKDKEFAASLAVTLICAVVKSLKIVNNHAEVMVALSEFCEKVIKQPNHLTPVAMEILYECNLKFVTEDLVRAAEAMKLQPLGILILEKLSVNCEKYNSSKSKEIDEGVKNHLSLAKLYRSIGEHDMSTSILENWKLPSEIKELRKVPALEANGDWNCAKSIYEELYKNKNTHNAKEYCLDGTVECLFMLGSWKEINQKIPTILPTDNLDSIWESQKRNLSWIIKAQLHNTLQDITNDRSDSNSTFTKSMNKWFYTKRDEIIKPYGEELSVFHLFCKEIRSESIARICLENSLNEVAIQMNDSKKEKYQLSNKLKRLEEIEKYLETLKAEDILNATKRLIKYWDKDFPKVNDDLSSWYLLTNYRLAFMQLVRAKLDGITTHTSSVANIQTQLTVSGYKERLKLANIALDNRNRYVYRRQVQIKSEKILNLLSALDVSDRRIQKLKCEFEFASARYEFLNGELKDDTTKKLQYYCESLKICNKLLKAKILGSTTRSKTLYHAFNVSNTLLNFLRKQEVGCAIENIEVIAECLNIKASQINGLEDTEILQKVLDILSEYGCNKLEEISPEGDAWNLTAGYAKFAEYLYTWIMTNDTGCKQLLEKLIHSVFKAMSLSSKKAGALFLYLLNPLFYKDNECIAEFFHSESKTVPTWVFLALKDELVMQLATELKPLVSPIVYRLAREFPSSMQFSFKSFYDSQGDLKNDEDIQKIYQLIFADPKIEGFYKALEYLVEPERFLRCRLMDAINSKDLQTLKNHIDSTINEISADTPLQGNGKNNLMTVLTSFQVVIMNLETVEDLATAKARVKEICHSLDERMHLRLTRRKSKFTELQEYSIYLSQFLGENLQIEIPVVYNYRKNHSTRVTIARFDQFVEYVPDSSDLKIKMIGSDGKTYEFIVRCGIDLQREQRMQRILEFTNTFLDQDANCHDRGLRLSMRNVISVSRSLSLIQCTSGDVSSLKQLIYSPEGGESALQKVSSEYRKLMEVVQFCRAKDVVIKMKEFIESEDQGFLRKAFLKCSSTPDSFFKLRQSFIKKYATMCLVHWLTGIGDRRLENTLVNLETGECYGINLSIIFDTNFHQPTLESSSNDAMPQIPKLDVPFRLTPQILELMKPYSKQDLFATTMVHTLNALVNQKIFVLGCLGPFLRESIWQESPSTIVHTNNWNPRQKIRVIEKKLSGVNPSTIKITDFERFYGDNKIDDNMHLYESIISGKQPDHITLRRNFSDYWTPKKLVTYLLDQATDLNILGRLQAEWCPFA